MTGSVQDCLGNTGFYDQSGQHAVLLIHGLTGTPTEMKPVAKRLTKQGFSVMCPALAGHCGSVSDLKKSKWQDWYGTIERSFEALKAAGHTQVYVAGLSMGALIALVLAAEKGGRVDGPRGRSYVVLEGKAELSPVAADPYDDVVEDLVDYYRTASGEHPDWTEYREAMVTDQRVLLTVHVDKLLGVVR